MKLIVMTTPTFFVEEDKIIRILFDEGLDILHLRKPDTDIAYTERLLTLLPSDYRKRIILHDHFELKKEFGLMGIHLNKRHPYPPTKYKGIITQSVHNLADLRPKIQHSDYVLLSPVFDSSDPKSGKMVKGFPVEELHQASLGKKVMALGGISTRNIRQCQELGFGGVVVTSALWELFNIHHAIDYRDLVEYFKKLRSLSD